MKEEIEATYMINASMPLIARKKNMTQKKKKSHKSNFAA